MLSYGPYQILKAGNFSKDMNNYLYYARPLTAPVMFLLTLPYKGLHFLGN